MDHIVIWGVFWSVIFYFSRKKKKVKRGRGEGEEKVVKTFGLVRMTYGIRYLQNEPEEVRVSCKMLVRA